MLAFVCCVQGNTGEKQRTKEGRIDSKRFVIGVFDQIKEDLSFFTAALSEG
jgi:hypothetical protein